MHGICSNRAFRLVTEARLNYCKNLNNSASSNSPSPGSPDSHSLVSSPPCNSPIPAWWDDILEAADIQLQTHPSRKSAVVRKQLFHTPLKSAPEIHQESSILSQNNEVSTPVSGSNAFDCHASNHGNESVSFSNNAADDEGHHTQLTSSPCLSELDKNQDVNVQVCIDSVVCAGSVPQEIVSAQEHLSDFEANPTNGKIGKTLYQSHLRIQKAKIALNCGQQHMTSKGTLRLARCLKRSCQDKCKKCQSPRLTLEERTNINRMFWNLGEHQKQWEFIKSSVVISKPKKKFACTGAKGEKSQSRTYTFSVEGKARKVCKTMFKSTLSICDSWVDSALTHFSDFSGVVVDRRGKHNNRPKRGLKKRQNEKQSFNA